MSVMIQSSARGSKSWDFGKDLEVVISLGVNTLTAEEYKAVKDDPGFKAMIKAGKYKELKPADLKKKEKQEEKLQAKVTELDQAKAQHKKAVADLCEKHANELKAQKVKFDNERTMLIDNRKESLEKVKELEAELEKANSQLLKAGDLNGALEVAEKRVKDLESQNEALAKKVADSDSEVKKLQKKLKENGN